MLLKKIVVAEDDDTIAHLVNMALGDAGFLCMRAHDGDEALRLVRIHMPDLLVLDVMMPRVDGHEVARKLKSDVILSKIPILMLTALGDVDNKVAGFESGADDYLTKPFDLREFNARVNALIRAARRERDRNPTTDLPGSAAIDERIHAALQNGDALAVVHVGVSGYDAYADRVGFARAEELVGALGRALLAEVRQRGADFLGHLGGVDFVVLCDASSIDDLAGSWVEAFESKIGDWVDDREGLSLVVGAVATADVEDESVLAERLARAIRDAKQSGESSYVVWQPETT